MFLEVPNFTQVGCESFTKSPVVAGLESYLEKIQSRGMSKEVYRQVEQILPGTLDSIDPMRLTINPSRIMKDVGIESIGRKIGAFSIIGVVVAIVLRLIAWIVNKFKSKNGGSTGGGGASAGNGSTNYGEQIKAATENVKAASEQIKKRQKVVIDEYCENVVKNVKAAKANKVKNVELTPSDDLTPDELAKQYATALKEEMQPIRTVINNAVHAALHPEEPEEKSGPTTVVEIDDKHDVFRNLIIGAFKANCKGDPKYKQALAKIKQVKGDEVVDIGVLTNVFKYGVVGIDTITKYEKFVGPFFESNRVDKIAEYLSKIVNVISNVPSHKNDYKKWEKDLADARKNALLTFKFMSNATNRIKLDEDTLAIEYHALQDHYDEFAKLLNFEETACSAIVDMRSLDGFFTMVGDISYNSPATIFDISENAVHYYKFMANEIDVSGKIDQKELEKRLSELEANPDWKGGEVKTNVQQLATFSVTVMGIIDKLIQLQLRNVKIRQKYMRGA